MITREEALGIATAKIRSSWSIAEDEPLMSDEVREEDFGWVFFYGSRRFAETGDFRYAIAGNGPVVVERESGAVLMLGTAFGVDYQLNEYRRIRSRA